eukprot:717755-Rhodomonas_salina.1
MRMVLPAGSRIGSQSMGARYPSSLLRGTAVAYGAMMQLRYCRGVGCYDATALCGPDMAYGHYFGTFSAVLICRMVVYWYSVWRVCCALCGTDIPYGGLFILRFPGGVRMRDPVIGYAAMHLLRVSQR